MTFFRIAQRGLALVPTILSLACAGASTPASEPVIRQFDEAALDAYLASLEDEERKTPAAGVEAEAMYLEMIDDAKAMPEARRGPFVARTLADLAEHRLEHRDIPGALRAADRAGREAEGDEGASQAVNRVRFDVFREAGLDAVRRGHQDRGLGLLEKAMRLPGVTDTQRDRLAGDRYVVLAQYDSTPAARPAPRPKKIVARPSVASPEPKPVEEAAALTVASVPIDARITDSALPETKAAPATDSGAFDSTAIEQVVTENKGAIAACYNRALKAGTARRGKLELVVTVLPNGIVQDARIDGARFGRSSVARCIADKVERWRFPTFSGAPREAIIPFVLNH